MRALRSGVVSKCLFGQHDSISLISCVFCVFIAAVQVAVMNLPAPAESLCLAHMAAEQAAGGSNEQLFLYIGLTNGVCQRVGAHKCGPLERSATWYGRVPSRVLSRSLSKS